MLLFGCHQLATNCCSIELVIYQLDRRTHLHLSHHPHTNTGTCGLWLSCRPSRYAGLHFARLSSTLATPHPCPFLGSHPWAFHCWMWATVDWTVARSALISTAGLSIPAPPEWTSLTVQSRPIVATSCDLRSPWAVLPVHRSACLFNAFLCFCSHSRLCYRDDRPLYCYSRSWIAVARPSPYLDWFHAWTALQSIPESAAVWCVSWDVQNYWDLI